MAQKILLVFSSEKKFEESFEKIKKILLSYYYGVSIVLLTSSDPDELKEIFLQISKQLKDENPYSVFIEEGPLLDEAKKTNYWNHWNQGGTSKILDLDSL